MNAENTVTAASAGRPARTPAALPDFPWDSLAGAKAKAAAHPDGIVNLSVGTPVDPVADSIREALAESSAAPGYPQTMGTPALREAIAASLGRRYRMLGLGVENVLPVIGTKEAIASLPSQLGIGAGHPVMIPTVAYPTYEVAALVAGATPVRRDSPEAWPADLPAPSLIFINSPSNPTGAILGEAELKQLVAWAREIGAILASDECYLGLNWSEEPAPSILDPEVCGGDFTGLLAIHSLSKTSNLASYRSGFLVGDAALIAELLEIRKHTGLMMPGPIQAATVAALDDDAQEAAQKERYRSRRRKLLAAVRAAGFEVVESKAGLYLWLTRGEDCRDTVDWFAERGILVAPGDFYGPESTKFVRMALTETDERIDAACARLAHA